jgi:hypothetical protein
VTREQQRSIRQACDEWGPVLKRLIDERGMKAPPPTRDDEDLVALTIQLDETLRTIRSDQQERDRLPGLEATLRSDGVPETEIRREAAEAQDNVERLTGEVDVILDYPRTVYDIERLLSYIRATP